MTVEAALVLPVFLYCTINVMCCFRMIETQSRVLAAAHQTGNEICFYGYGTKYFPEKNTGGLTSIVMAEAVARAGIVTKLGDSVSHNIKGGLAGLSMAGSSVFGAGDIVDIRCSWFVKPFASQQGFILFPMSTRYYGKAWTGYEGDGAEAGVGNNDRIVYITEHGVVYHLSRDCSHLNPTIQMVLVDTIDSKRNNSGAKYYPCSSCKGGSIQSVCYITPDGNKYHSNPNCSGLKRTIYAVRLSEVGGKGPCSTCGG